MTPKALAQSRQQFGIQFDRDQLTTRRVEPAGQFFGRMPRPGPTSITQSSGAEPAAPAIRGGTLISRRKCWPSHFLV